MKKILIAGGAALLAVNYAAPTMACEFMRTASEDMTPVEVTVTAEAIKTPGKATTPVAESEAPKTEVSQAEPVQAAPSSIKTEVAQAGETATR